MEINKFQIIQDISFELKCVKHERVAYMLIILTPVRESRCLNLRSHYLLFLTSHSFHQRVLL